MDNNCIHVVEHLDMSNFTIKSQSDVLDLVKPAILQTLSLADQAQFEIDDHAVNVYTLQKIFLTTLPSPPAQDPIYQFWAHKFSNSAGYSTAIVRLDDFPLIIHELGHTVGLVHTFGTADGFDLSLPPTATNKADCKKLGALIFDQQKCQYTGDGICDTGLDPWDLDLGPSPGVADGYKDFHKWVDKETCTQITDLLASYKDGCFDCTEEWHIPTRNYMSYYRTCRSEFTTGQFWTMHQQLQMPNCDVLMDCDEDPYAEYTACSDPDIVIDDPGITPWSNMTVELCPGQKIIIKPGSKLVIDHCLLTRKETTGPNSSCPGFMHESLWDGIYIEGNPTLFGTSSNYGDLEITNSIVEYSKNGIKAAKGFWGINISSSTFRHNMAQINVSYPYTFSSKLAQKVYMSESNFTVGDPALSLSPLAPVQIRVLAGNIVFKGCTLTNPNEDIDLTGIQSFKGNLAIINGSKIENFHIGVNKTGYGFYAEIPRGLTITSSTVKNCDVSILNSSFFATVSGNFLEGDVISEGSCYGNWLSNNVKSKTITLQSPVYANRIENNLFQNLEFDLYGYNKKSSATCNTWKDVSADAVVGHPEVHLISAWGDKQVSSGNRHLDNTDPLMVSEAKLTNYYYQFEPSESFSYSNNHLLIGEKSEEDKGCSLDYPTSEPVPIENFPEVELNYTSENTKWVALNILKLQKIALLVTATDSQALILNEKIDQYEFEMDNVVGNVLGNLTKADSAIENTWKTRANPLLFVLTDLIELWYKQDFEDLSDAAEGIIDGDAETLLAASEFLENHCGAGRRLDSLSTLEVDTLSKIAALTFGHYSNVIRDFLRLQYNIDIPWPLDNQVTYRAEKSTPKNKPVSGVDHFSVFQNGKQGCLTIQSHDKKDQEIFVTIYDYQGRRLESKQTMNNTNVCFAGTLTGIFIVTIYEPKSGAMESHKIVIY